MILFEYSLNPIFFLSNYFKHYSTLWLWVVTISIKRNPFFILSPEWTFWYCFFVWSLWLMLLREMVNYVLELGMEWLLVEPVLCNVTCLNGGYCSPDSHQCVCTPNCRGVSCEKCSWNIPFGAIVAFFVGLVLVWYVCIWVSDLITRKCR